MTDEYMLDDAERELRETLGMIEEAGAVRELRTRLAAETARADALAERLAEIEARAFKAGYARGTQEGEHGAPIAPAASQRVVGYDLSKTGDRSCTVAARVVDGVLHIDNIEFSETANPQPVAHPFRTCQPNVIDAFNGDAPEGFVTVEIGILSERCLDAAIKDAGIARDVCGDLDVILSAGIHAYLLAASKGGAKIYSPSQRRVTGCQSNCDGDCDWSGCPQLRDGEPAKTGRHCPLDSESASKGGA